MPWCILIPMSHELSPAQQFKRAVRQVGYIYNPDSSVMRGVEINPAEGGVTFVTTDGVRISRSSLVKADSSLDEPILLGRQSLQNVRTFLPESDKLHIDKTPTGIEISTNNHKFTVDQVDGSFPKWQEVIPDFKLGTQATFNPRELLRALRKAHRQDPNDLFNKNDQIRLYLSGRVLSMSARKQHESGQVHHFGFFDVTDVRSLGKPNISAALNARFLRQFLFYAGAESHIMHDTNDDEEPKLTFLKPEDPLYFHLIMKQLWGE